MARPKKCPECGDNFVVERMGQKTCRKFECAIAYGRKAREKKEANAKKETARSDKARLEAMKTKPELTKEAQRAFNAYIRKRDSGMPCISCGGHLEAGAVGGGYDCGHYRSVGSAPHLRFVESNAHGQCKRCNRYLSGNVTEYRAGLIERIGLDAVAALEADQMARHYTAEDLRYIRDHYRQLAK